MKKFRLAVSQVMSGSALLVLLSQNQHWWVAYLVWVVLIFTIPVLVELIRRKTPVDRTPARP